MLRSALLIAGNDLRRRLRNRSFVIQAFVGPLVLAVVISAAFGGGFGIKVRLGVAVEDDSELAVGLRQGLLERDVGDGVEFVEVTSAADALDKLDDDEIEAAVVIPAGFGASLAETQPLDLGVMTDEGQDAVGAAVARAVAAGIAAQINTGRLVSFAMAFAGRPVPDAAALAEVELPIQLGEQGPGELVSPAASIGPGMGLLFLFLSVSVVARGLIEEQRLRVLDRIRAAPVSTSSILLGKGLGVVVLGCATLGTLWWATTVLLGAAWGDPAGVVLLIVTAAVAVAGIGGVVAALARTEQSADLYATMVAFILSMIGGSLIPLSELPDSLYRLSVITPNGWAQRGFAELSAGRGGVGDIVPHLLVLLAWAVAGGALGAFLLPRKLARR